MTARLIGKTDLHFDDPKLRRLQQHINRLTDELQKLQAMLDEGTAGQVLLKRSSADFDAVWAGESSGGGSEGGGGGDDGSSGGSTTVVFGEVNTGRNLGEGVGLFRDKTGVILNFRSLVGEDGIEIDLDEANDVVRISATSDAAAAAGQFEPLVIAGVFA